MSIETGCVLGTTGKVIHWHAPTGRTASFLPDDRDLWQVMWENRDRLGGFAHSHPGSGRPSPSHEDVTTFLAVESALGRRLQWWIVSRDSAILLHRIDPSGKEYVQWDVDPTTCQVWLGRLRELSYGGQAP